MSKSDQIQVLYVEDDPSLGFVVQDRLKADGFRVHLCRDGKSALQQYNKQHYDLCILDVMLPEKDGFSLAKDIRKMDKAIPILFLTARVNLVDKETGYASGADDYLTKPFEHKELILRVNALLRRSRPMVEEKEEYSIGEYLYRPNAMELIHDGQQRRLTKTENKVLRILCQHQDRVIERDLLLNMVWGKDDYATGRSLDVYLSKLRKYLSSDKRIKIENAHGVGFKLEVDE